MGIQCNPQKTCDNFNTVVSREHMTTTPTPRPDTSTATSVPSYSEAVKGFTKNVTKGSLVEVPLIEKALIKSKNKRQRHTYENNNKREVKPGQLKNKQIHSTGSFYGEANKISENLEWRTKVVPNKKSKADITKVDRADKINEFRSVVHPGGDKSHFPNLAADYDVNDTSAPEKTREVASDDPDLIDLTTFNESSANGQPAVVQSYMVGFKNYDNTCYLNSSVQSLLGLPMLVTDFLQIDITEIGRGLLKSFHLLCMACSKGNCDEVNREMKEIKKDLEQLDEQFLGNKMQDASEFLCRLVDEMNDELSTSLKLNNLGLKDVHNNIIESNFLHVKEEVYVCLDCGFKTKGTQGDLSLWCDVVSPSVTRKTRSVCLQQLLERSLAEEMIDKRCEECGCERATKSSSFVALPRVLTIYLKRYKYEEPNTVNGGKIRRNVDIPEKVFLSNLVADSVTLPDTRLPSLNLQISQVFNQMPPVTPPRQKVATQARLGQSQTPTKFKNISEEDITKLNEEDQLKYALYLSKKEGNIEGVADCEDKQLLAALEASLKDFVSSELGEDTCINPAKRSQISMSRDNWENRLPDPTSDFQGPSISSYSNAVKGGSGLISEEIQTCIPVTLDEEEANLKRALEISIQEVDTKVDPFEIAESNIVLEEEEETSATFSLLGLEEHSYKLHSVVSHHGTRATSGHYVADVFRFDGGGWFRYDDTRVVPTEGESVRTGSNKSNGYILTYLYSPLWDQCSKQAARG